MNRSITILLATALLLCSFSATARERTYQMTWCAANNGTAEVVLSDGTRVDCVTATHAVEVDFAPKWAEAIGQALHYALITGKRPGILLIVGPTDNANVDRLKRTIDGLCLHIDVWTVQR